VPSIDEIGGCFPVVPMAYIRTDDILVPSEGETADPRRNGIAAFIPIAIAILGVAAILMGRVTFAEFAASDVPNGVDPIATGSIGATAPTAPD
jgi:hypothetical protein